MLKKFKLTPEKISKWTFNVALIAGAILLISQFVNAWTPDDAIEIRIDEDQQGAILHKVIDVVARPAIPGWIKDQAIQYELTSYLDGVGFNLNLDDLGPGIYTIEATIVDENGTRHPAEFKNNLVLNPGFGPNFTINFHPENFTVSLFSNSKDNEEVIRLVER